jgi:hypothetical protein
MARENIGAPEASQRTNRKLKDVAADLIARQAKSGGQS